MNIKDIFAYAIREIYKSVSQCEKREDLYEKFNIELY